ncbi:hypothetical protein BKA82DRAFT_3986329, partial [Pisolithus tinctorius]
HSNCQTQNDYIQEWLPHKEEFMKVLLDLEAPPKPQNCARCGAEGGYRCPDCIHQPLFCKECCRVIHQGLLFHRVQQWAGNFFEESALHMTGAELHLGHSEAICPSDLPSASRASGTCPIDGKEWEDVDDMPPHLRRPVGSKYLTMVDVTRVHFIPVHWCQCEDAEAYPIQLLREKLFPATFEKPSTTFTFAVLDDFMRDNLECRTTRMNYYSKLRWITSAVFPHLVPDRYHELLRVTRQWQLLKQMKWSSILECTDTHKRGDLALFCTTCPQLGINIDPTEDLNHWKYARTLVMDGNFKAKHMHDRRPADQVWMMDGRGYMVSDSKYQAYLQATPHVTEKSPCNNHRAINQANANRGKLHSTGIGATACAWHGCFYLHSVVDFQKGERQLNMDYSLANALHYNMAGINKVLCFYDINCSYMKNLRMQVGNSSFIEILQSLQIMPGIGIWHVHGHKQECYARYAPLFMKGAGWVDGEIIKTLWSLLNVVSASTQGMSSPHQQELLDFQMSDCNFMKMIQMGNLSRKLAAVQVAADLVMQAFQMLDEGVSISQRHCWRNQEETAFNNRICNASAMDVFEVQMKKAPTVHAVELELLENTSNVGIQLGIGSWLVRGLRLEEASIMLQIDHHHVAIARQMECLSSEQSVFIADGVVYFGVQHEAGGISPAEHGWDGSMDDPFGISGECASDPDEPNDSTDGSLTADAADLVGSMSLPLPSNLGINQCIASGLDGIWEIELKLQIGQANDVLHGLWLALVDKAVVLQNAMQQAKSYAMKTRAWDMIHTINGTVRKQAAIYKQCRAAMVSLGATEETLSRFQEMQKLHLTVSTVAISQNVHDHWGSQLPWFWSIDMPRDTESNTWMSEFYRIHWLRAKAVQDRWTEEEELLTAKFQWTLNFFTHRAVQWQLFQSKCEAIGPTCYTAKQIAIFERLAEQTQFKRQEMNLTEIPNLMDLDNVDT